MKLQGIQSSVLVSQFRAFYEEVVRLKRGAQLTASERYAVAAAGAGTSAEVIATSAQDRVANDAVWPRLLSMLKQQALDAGRLGGVFAAEVYREAQYVMAALADEVFLHLDWDGRSSWRLLESELFHTHAAGEILFERLDLLLRQRDPVYNDLAAIYLMALSLGFQGKYRGQDDGGRLALYRRQLFAMIYRQDPQLFGSEQPLLPQTEKYTLAGGKARHLPDPRVWWWLVLFVLLAWVAVTQFLWLSLSGDVNCMMRQVTGKASGADAGCLVEALR